MLFLKSWLQDYIDLSGLEEKYLTQTITFKAGEVDEIIKVVDPYMGLVKVGKITNVRPHPNADRLKIFDLDLGSKDSLQIISAAPNVRNDIYVPVAVAGARLSQLSIKESKMRGELSQGMCLGKSELNLETPFSSGLWELDSEISNPEAYLGQSIATALPKYFPEETIYDIKFLADKIASCGNHLGLAREIGIILGQPERLTQTARELMDPAFLLEKIVQEVEIKKASDIEINFQDSTGYTNSFFLYSLKLQAKFDLDYKIRQRMFLTGKNLTSTPADASNYLLADIGQPTHFFSKNQLTNLLGKQNQKWEVKVNQENRNFQGLGKLKSAKLGNQETILINQDNKIIHLPGISGSEETKTGLSDTEIIVEIANFEAEKVSESAFNLNYRSDGARIWSGGVNLNLHLTALYQLSKILPGEYQNLLAWIRDDLKTQLDLQGETFVAILSAIADYTNQTKITPKLEYIKSRISHSKTIEDSLIQEKLSLLGVWDGVDLYPNSFYDQLPSQEDLLEEVSRLVGYTDLPKEYLNISTSTHKNLSFWQDYSIKNLVANFGFNEILPRPLLNPKNTINNDKIIQLKSYPSEEFKAMRTSLLDTGLEAISYNISKGYKDIKLFELGPVYLVENQNVLEKNMLWVGSVNKDPYILTSLLYGLSQLIQNPILDTNKLEDGYEYILSDKIAAKITQVSNEIKKKFQIPLSKEIFSLEVDLTDHPKNLNTYPSYQNLSSYPTLKRSYSLEIQKSLQYNQIKNLILTQDLAEIEVQIKPIERIHNEESDILNIQVNFLSYQKSLDSEIIQDWEAKTFAKLKTIGLIKIR